MLRSRTSSEREALLPASDLHKRQSTWWYGQLKPEQKRAANFILSRITHGGGAALFSKQGTGKTYIAMAVLEAIKPQLALIVSPLTSLDITWSPRLETLPGSIVRSPRELTGSLDRQTLLINPEVMTKQSKALARIPWDIVIIDESQGIKDRNSQRSRAARRLRNAKRRLILSGTPIDESQIDVWAQMRFVDHTVFGENWTDFAMEYCRKGGYMGHEWIFSKKKHDQFLDKLKNHIFRLSIDFMKLKPLSIIHVPVRMFGRQAELYQKMHDQSMINLGNACITAPLTIVRDVKLAQITGGFVLDESNEAFPVGEAKERKLRYLISRIDPPIVVFCHYLHELSVIARVTGHLKTAILHGGVKGDQRTQVLRKFQEGKFDVIICQMRTGGVSIELSRSSNLILYSINHSYIDFEQMISRLHRGGQERQVNVWLLYCVDTIDEEKLGLIERKASLAYNVLSPFERRS